MKVGFLSILLLVFVLPDIARADLFDHQAEQHKGPFVQAGMMGSIDTGLGGRTTVLGREVDFPRLFDIGPGAFVGVGYNFGILGVRSNFHYAQMDSKRFKGLLQSDLYGGSLELKIMPLGERDIFFQPYLVAGAGAHYLELNALGASIGDWGFAGNGGLGFDIFIVDGLALTLETNIRPTVFYSDSGGGGGNDYDMYFYDFMGGITYVFGGEGKKEEARVVPAPAPVPVAKSEPKKVYKTGEKIDLKGRINFKTNSAEILPSSYAVLDDAVEKMQAHPEIAMVEIEGHTDSMGSDQYNLGLSQRRSESVKNYFINRGISANRLTTKGYGETQPVATNETAEGRADNRRIVFRVTQFN